MNACRQAMDTCSMEVAAATLCSLDEKPSLALLAAILTTLLIAAIVALAVAAVIGCKIRLEKREKTIESLKSPMEERGRERGELVPPALAVMQCSQMSQESWSSTVLASQTLCQRR